MGRIYYIMGKSSSGKDTIFKRLLEDPKSQFETIVLYTTRPKRIGEVDGVEYFFSTEEELDQIRAEGKLIELRSYQTIHGVWKYFTVDDGQIDLKTSDCLVIGTLVSYEKMKEYYGENQVIPIYIQVDDGERLERALQREKTQKEPRYAEMCRRFLADEEDFSEEKLKQANIQKRFQNIDTVQCLKEIWTYIEENKRIEKM